MKPSSYVFGRLFTLQAGVIAAMLLFGAPSGAQTLLADGEPAAAPTLANIAAYRKAVAEDGELVEGVQAKALEFYDRAAEALGQIEKIGTETAALVDRIEKGPARVAEIRELLKSPRSPTESVIPASDATVEELQAVVNEKRVAFTVAQDVLNQKEAALASIKQSGKAIVEDYVARERSLSKITTEADAPPAADAAPALVQARSTYLRARLILEKAKFEQLRRAYGSYELLAELATLERELAAADAAAVSDQRQVLEQALQERREADARIERWEAVAAISETAQLPSAVVAVAEETAKLKTELVAVIERERDMGDALRAVSRQYQEIKDKFQSVRGRIAAYGASQALGRLLQRRLENLPSPRAQQGFARERQRELVRVTDRRIEVEDALQQMQDTDARVTALLSSIEPALEPEAAKALLGQTTDLIQAQRDTLVELDRTYGRYLTRLGVIEAADQEVAKMADELATFIRKELTWIPNLSPLSPTDFRGFPQALGWLLAPANWRQALSDAGRTAASHPLYSILALLAIALTMAGRWLARRRLPQIAELIRRIRTDTYRHTVKALLLTVVAAAAWPLIFAVIGWQVEADPIGGPFGNAVGSAFQDVVRLVFLLSLLKWLTRRDGLGRRHFRWPAEISEALHKRIGWLALLLVPTAFLVNLSSHAGVTELSYAIGRPMLLVALLILAAFVWRIFRRSGAFMRYFEEHQPDGWISRLRVFWFPVFLGVPVALFFGAILGYAHTAAQLTGLLVGETALLLLVLLIVRDMLLRWFYVIERRSRLETAVRQREEARAGREQRDDETTATGFDIEIPEVDYRELGEQARAVIRVSVLIGVILSVGSIWGELLPAFGFLDSIDLPFFKIEMVDGVEQQFAVSLADLGVGILILAGTLFAAKNLSGLLGFTLLRSLRLDAGGNYAIVTLCQYLVVAIGVLVAFSVVGLQWSKLQWLIAALSVGLGFGLQEIVANFVSGIILLLERPVRIGDIVTVGGVDGYVSRIQIRATTILTWEKKELIIPNKEFITGKVVNWTLSDSVNRILINVGIAYGSDVGKALELLKVVTKENEYVLEDPKPVITFEAFGDNALMLYVRCYISSLDHRLETITSLHESIYAAFATAGIVIAFPQRDVHLDTSKPLEIRVRQEGTQALGNPES
jgi:potassium efflux system protein